MYTSLWQCNKTIQEILIARGYGEQQDLDQDDTEGVKINQAEMVKDYHTFEKTIDELCGKQGLDQSALDKLTYLRQHKLTLEWIYVFFITQKIGVKEIQQYAACMDTAKVSRAILVSVPTYDRTEDNQSILTTFALKEITSLNSSEAKIIEHFYSDQLIVNILKHERQPKSITILTPDEVDDVIKDVTEPNSGKIQLPVILPDDPVAKLLGLQIGDVIKCTNHSPTVGEKFTYRLCTIPKNQTTFS